MNSFLCLVESNVFESSAAEQGKKAVRNGAIGAAIGAIAGGGKGAAIGAGAGAGGGVGTTVLMKGEHVRIPWETRLMFALAKPFDVTITPGTAAAAQTPQNSPSGPARLDPSTQTRPDDRPRVRRRPQR